MLLRVINICGEKQKKYLVRVYDDEGTNPNFCKSLALQKWCKKSPISPFLPARQKTPISAKKSPIFNFTGEKGARGDGAKKITDFWTTFSIFCVFFMTHFGKKCDDDAVKIYQTISCPEFGDKILQFHEMIWHCDEVCSDLCKKLDKNLFKKSLKRLALFRYRVGN